MERERGGGGRAGVKVAFYSHLCVFPRLFSAGEERKGKQETDCHPRECLHVCVCVIFV
jgi:hypothetical protein